MKVESQKCQCNIVVHTIHGEHTTYAHDGGGTDSGTVVRTLARDEENKTSKDLSTKSIHQEGLPWQERRLPISWRGSSKPNVAVIRGVGASAAYWASTGADKIYASRSSGVGSIGVAVSFRDESEKNKKEGIAYNEFALGIY